MVGHAIEVLKGWRGGVSCRMDVKRAGYGEVVVRRGDRIP